MTDLMMLFVFVFGIFIKMLPLILVIALLQIFVCKNAFKRGKIIPLLSLIFLIICEILYFYLSSSFGFNTFIIISGVFLIIPFGSLFFVSTFIYIRFKNKINVDKELLQVKIQDL